MMNVSVIMPTFNKAEYLGYTITSFLLQKDVEFQLCVIDDGSIDGTSSLLEAITDPRVVVISQENKGRSAARNAGIGVAQGDILVFCDDDRLVGPNFLTSHVAAQQSEGGCVVLGTKQRILSIWKSGLLPIELHDCLAVTGRTPGLSRKMDDHEVFPLIAQEDLSDFEETIRRTFVGDEIDNHSTLLAELNYDISAFSLAWALGTSSNMSVPRKYLGRTLGFDERYRGWGLEDTDLCYELHRRGLRFRIDQAAVNYHQIHPLGAGGRLVNAGTRASECADNLRAFCEKHDTLGAYLFWRCQNGMSLTTANALAEKAAADPYLEDELLHLYRTTFALQRQCSVAAMSGGIVSGHVMTPPHLIGVRSRQAA